MCSPQYEETKTELSDLKEKYEQAEQEKRSLTEELDDCKANMKEYEEKGTKVSAGYRVNIKECSLVLFYTNHGDD